MEMRFGHNHYVPVLRWKAAEIGALSELSNEVSEGITPLIELCPTAFTQQRKRVRVHSLGSNPEGIISSRVGELRRAIGGKPVFVDLQHLPPSLVCANGRHIWDAIRQQGIAAGLSIIPVTGFFGKGLGSQAEVSKTHLAFGCGVAIRLIKNDLERPTFARDLFKLLEIQQVEMPLADLILDFQLVDVAFTGYASLFGLIPEIAAWRTLTVLAGSFPVDLASLRANNTYVLPRHEWSAWKNTVQGFGGHQRLPSFGDYTIQHPMYREPVEFPHVSASIRYTLEDSWLILRGEWIGKKTGSGSAQYPAEAKLLAERPDYCGEGFSFGDKFIAAKARDGSKPGNPKQWLLAGVNHHMTLAATMIQKGPLLISQGTTTIPAGVRSEV